jgi:hypothetical protein
MCHQSATIDTITCPILDSGPSPQQFSGKEKTCKECTGDESQCMVDKTSFFYFSAGDAQALELSNSSSPASGSDAEALVDFVKSLRNDSNTHTY